jgi:hypothetical protein
MTIGCLKKVARALSGALLLMLSSNVAPGQNPGPGSQVPPQLRPSEGARLLLHTRAKGDQVYTCKKDDGRYSWILKAPEAQLFDESGRAIGRHFAGPAWQLNDNSQVTGKVVARSDAADSDAIPWLLLAAVDHSGEGLLRDVAQIQRLNTKGGKAPATGCDEQHAGNETRTPYTADYFFYSNPNRQ